MLLSEVAKEVNLTKRAIKYYEEQELLHVPKDANGYRNYSEEHLNILKEISVYRKLGIGIADIKKILETRDFSLLEQIYQYLNPTDEEYQRLLEQTRKNVKLRNSFFCKYHPAFISQRRFMRELQNQGYNDIFIPNMIALSPKYKEYHDALTAINKRICDDRGLYYNSNYHLIMK